MSPSIRANGHETKQAPNPSFANLRKGAPSGYITNAMKTASAGCKKTGIISIDAGSMVNAVPTSRFANSSHDVFKAHPVAKPQALRLGRDGAPSEVKLR